MLTFDDSNSFAGQESDQMLFGPVDFDDYIASSPPAHLSWDPLNDLDNDVKPVYEFSPSSPLSPADSGYYDSMDAYNMPVHKGSPPPDTHQFLSNWINDPELSMASSSSPIPIPSHTSSFTTFAPSVPFPLMGAFSPTEYAAVQPRSMSPSSDDQYSPHQANVDSISPQDMSLQTPPWATQLWDNTSTVRASSSRPLRHSLLRDSTIRPRLSTYRSSISA
jgi:hypothetical protein